MLRQTQCFENGRYKGYELKQEMVAAIALFASIKLRAKAGDETETYNNLSNRPRPPGPQLATLFYGKTIIVIAVMVLQTASWK